MPVDTVFVDAGGVLLVPDPARVAAVLAPFGVTVDDATSARGHYAGVAQLERGIEGDRASFMPYHSAYATACGVASASIADAVNALADEFLRAPIFRCVLPGAQDTLRALAAQGLQVAIVTNSGGWAEQQLVETGICQVGPGPLANVDAVVDSTIVGFEKPDPRIFEHTLELLGADRDRTIHVGDTPKADVDGAIAAGIRPVLVDPYDFYVESPHLRVHEFPDVPALVARLNA